MKLEDMTEEEKYNLMNTICTDLEGKLPSDCSYIFILSADYESVDKLETGIVYNCCQRRTIDLLNKHSKLMEQELLESN